jgi:DNA gyrase subunit A
VAGAKLKDEDYITDLIHTSAHAFLLFFSNRGKVYRLKAHRIPQRDRTAQGLAIVNLLRLQPDEKIQTIIDTRDYETHRYLFFVTRNGVVKKTMFNAYDSSRQDGLIAVSLRDGDELVRVIPTSGDDDILLVSEAGQGIRFAEDDVRPMGRTAAGVRGMKLREGDRVVGADVVAGDLHLLTVTDAGYGKRTDVDEFTRQGRGGQGIRAHRLHADRGRVVTGFLAAETDDVLLINDGGVIIRTGVGSISIQGRSATGVRVMNLDGDSKVAAVARVLSSEDGSDEDGPGSVELDGADDAPISQDVDGPDDDAGAPLDGG